MSEGIDILHLILSEHPEAIIFIKSKYLDDEDWEDAVTQNPEVFPYCKDPSYDMCRIAVEYNGEFLFHCPENLWDRYLVTQAVVTTPRIITSKKFPEKYKTFEMTKLAVEHDPSILGDVDLPDEEIHRVIRWKPSAIRYLKHPSEELCCYAITRDPNVILSFKKITPAMLQVIYENYPDFNMAFPEAKDDKK